MKYHAVRIFITALWCKLLNSVRGLLGRPRCILLYPEKPRFDSYVLLYMGRFFGWRITNDVNDKYDLAIFWEATTFRKANDTIKELSQKYPVLNQNCFDISKQHVDTCFKKVFGYSPMVNPLTYTGLCVKKSDKNGAHDGKIIECPIEKTEDGYVYQKLIDTEMEEKFVSEVRVPVFNKTIPFVYYKLSPIEDRFNISVKGRVIPPQDHFSKDELKKILKFCEHIGMDYGELDTLRDRHDGTLYIIDANNTPCVNFTGFSVFQKLCTILRVGKALDQMLSSLANSGK